MCIAALTLVRVAEAAAVGAALGPVRMAVEVFRIRAARHAEVGVVEEVVKLGLEGPGSIKFSESEITGCAQ